MRTINFIYDGKLPDSLDDLSGNILVQIFHSGEKTNCLIELASKLRNKFNEAIIVGQQAPLSLLDGNFTDKLSVVVTSFNKTRLKVSNIKELRDFRRTIYSMVEADTKGFLILSNRYLKLDELNQSLEMFKDYYFFGSLGVGPSFVYLNDNLDYDGLVLVSFSGEVEIHSYCFSSYKGIGNFRHITKVENERVLEIDGQGVAEFYHHIFNSDKLDLSYMQYFPLICKRLGDKLTFIPEQVLADGSAIYPINFKLNDEVKLAYLDNKDLQEQYEDLLYSINSYNTESIFVYSSIHKYPYQEKFDFSKINEISNKIVPMNGILNDVEITCIDGTANFTNGASVIVTLAEENHKIKLDPKDVKITPFNTKKEEVQDYIINYLIQDMKDNYNNFILTHNIMNDNKENLVLVDDVTGLYNHTKLLEDVKGHEFDFNISTCKLTNETFFRNYYGDIYVNDCKKEIVSNILAVIEGKANLYYYQDGFTLASTISVEEHRELTNYVCKRIFKYGYNYHEDILDFGLVNGTCFKGNKHPITNAKRALSEAILKGVESVEFGLTSNYLFEIKEDFDAYSLLTKAYKEKLFKPYYQGIYSVKDDTFRIYESLVRIIDNNKVYPPISFIELAYKFGYSRVLTKQVLEHNVKTLLANQDIYISMNIRLQDLIDEDFEAYFFKITNEYQVKNRLIIEILENDDIFRNNLYLNRIKDLKDKGVIFAIDDFGTGYSNLRYFELDAFKFIKLAGELSKNLSQINNQLLIESITEMAHLSNLEVVAEFCEDERSATILKSLGVDYIQGYYYSKPGPAIK